MVIARQPLTPAARLIAGFLAAVCLTGSGLAVIVAITRPSPGLAILALPVLALGVLYAGAAWHVIAGVPEPATALLFGLGLFVLALFHAGPIPPSRPKVSSASSAPSAPPARSGGGLRRSSSFVLGRLQWLRSKALM